MKRYGAVLICMLVFDAHAATLQSLTRQCRANGAEACHDLGYRYDQKGEMSKAATFYKHACDLRHAMGCYRLAELYLVGAGVTQSDASFITYTQKACRLGYAKSCSFGQKAAPVKQTTEVHKKKPKVLRIHTDALGKITVHTKYIDRRRRIIQIDASMTNLWGRASGWLSFSFPQLSHNTLIKSTFDGFDHVKAYPKGFSIYNTAEKKAMRSRYLLVEGEAKHWARRRTCKTTISLKVPPEIETLTLYVRGTLKRGKQIRSFPKKGTVGQQGFHNYRYSIPLGADRQKESAGNNSVSLEHISPIPSGLPTNALSRRDKLILLDQLFSLSYFHRERKAFEKQLNETLFGGATYLSFIKTYRCKPKQGSNQSRCILTLTGEVSRENKPMHWEFRVTFTARKEDTGAKITAIDSLDLLE